MSYKEHAYANLEHVENWAKQVLREADTAEQDKRAYKKRIENFRTSFIEFVDFIELMLADKPSALDAAYMHLGQIVRCSTLLGSGGGISKQAAKHHKDRGASTARGGKTPPMDERRRVARKYDLLPVKEALPLINADLEKKHLKAIKRSTLYAYRRPKLTV